MAGSTSQIQQLKVIGTRPIRHNGIDKVVGRARYGADYSAPRMLLGKMIRSPHANARIKSINAEKALRMRGAKAVITQDFAPLSNAVKFQYAGESHRRFPLLLFAEPAGQRKGPLSRPSQRNGGRN